MREIESVLVADMISAYENNIELDHPNVSHFGTGRRNISLKNLPPAIFLNRKMPSQGSNPPFHKKRQHLIQTMKYMK